jgi:hypothetical protein
MLKHTRLIAFLLFFILHIPDRIRIPDKMPDNDVIMGLALLSNAILYYVGRTYR